MTNEFSGIEKLLGLPEGSTKDITPEEAQKTIAQGIKQKADQLEKDMDKTETLSNMPNSDLVKCGLSINQLEEDKVTLRNEAFATYEIGKALLKKYKDDVTDQVDTSHLMYTAGAKILDSVTNSIDKLYNMVLKFKQEEEVKNMALVGENEDGKKEMTPDQWFEFVQSAQEETPSITEQAKDAEIIEEDKDIDTTP